MAISGSKLDADEEWDECAGPATGRRQLQRQGNPIQPVTDLGHRRRIVVSDRERGMRPARPVGE
jgi:hypothetical protein